MGEMIVASVASEIAKKKLTDSELSLMKELSKADSVEVVVPDNINPDKFRTALSAVCKNLARASLQQEILYPVLGKLMLVARDHKELWESKTVESYEAFIAATEKELGVSRSTLYEARSMVERWGASVSMQDFQLIGRVRLKQVSSVVPKGAERERTAKKLLGIAASGTVEEMDRFIESNYHRSRAERVGSVFEIPCNKEQEHRWSRFFKDSRVTAWVGSDLMSEKMDALIAESGQDWLDGGEAKMNQKTNGVVIEAIAE